MAVRIRAGVSVSQPMAKLPSHLTAVLLTTLNIVGCGSLGWKVTANSVFSGHGGRLQPSLQFADQTDTILIPKPRVFPGAYPGWQGPGVLVGQSTALGGSPQSDGDRLPRGSVLHGIGH